jgi:diguanylate cyclase (GGDEF)-like protein
MKKNPKVLYIEDDAETRSLMADIIRYRGYQFFEAERGIEGIRLAKKVVPDLILIDLRLPDMEGYEVTTLLKSIDELKDKPIVALTAESKKNVKELTLAAGCDGFINKPINVNEFLFKIEEYLSGRRDRLSMQDQQQFLQKYNVELVQKLSKKIIQLETINEDLSIVNKELSQSKDELARHNDRLFYLNNLANYLRKRKTPEEVLKILPIKTIEGFKVKRCILFRVDLSKSQLVPIHYSGIELKRFKYKKFSISPDLMLTLKQKSGLIWVRNNTDVFDLQLEKFSKSLKTSSFILSKLNDLGARSDSTQVLKSVTELENEQNLPQKYILFIDKGTEGAPMETYEVRILKSFIQTVGTIYENMLLYHHLLETYKIREQQAVTDELTNVYNYRYLMRELEREINRAQRFKMPFSIIMIDIDHFKNYNDINGHQMGDEVLKKFSALLKENTRKTDTVARYGGEEFLIVLPGVKLNRATEIATKIQALVEQEHFPNQEEQPMGTLTISSGVASFPQHGEDMKSLLLAVDQALYLAKHQGRNQVVVFDR